MSLMHARLPLPLGRSNASARYEALFRGDALESAPAIPSLPRDLRVFVVKLPFRILPLASLCIATMPTTSCSARREDAIAPLAGRVP